MKRQIKSSKEVLRRTSIMCSSNIDPDDLLGKVDDLPYKKLIADTNMLTIKDIEGHEGEILYTLQKADIRDGEDRDGYPERTEVYYLEPIEIEKVKVDTPEDNPFIRSNEYSVSAKAVRSGASRYYSTKMFGSYQFFTEKDAAKIKANATIILEHNDYLEQRSKEVDPAVAKEAANAVIRDRKVLQTNEFKNGEAEVAIGSSWGTKSDPVCVFMRFIPTDGPFMSSTMFEVYYMPMTDGTVYKSYGAFNHAVGLEDWFGNTGKAKQISQEDMFNEIKGLNAIYESLKDGFDSDKVSKEIHSLLQ